MAWNFRGTALLSTQYNGMAMIELIQSLARELARLEQEIEKLKKVKQ